MSWNTAFEVVSAAAAACRGCGACVPRCEVLACAGGADEPLSVGEVAAASADAAAGDDGEAARAAVAALAAERPELVLAVRRCCMDGFCTLVCPDGIDARGVFSALRVLLHEARLTGDGGFTMTRVDQEWHIFSAYRAVHGIFYNDLPSLENARAWGADTLFFPGCSLVSYAPELTREVFAWLQEQGASVALSTDCCGSPLRSGGFADRCEAHKAALVSRAREAGIKRVVFVCPGCRDEWETTAGAEAFELVALPELLAAAGARPRPEKVAALAGCAPIACSTRSPMRPAPISWWPTAPRAPTPLLPRGAATRREPSQGRPSASTWSCSSRPASTGRACLAGWSPCGPASTAPGLPRSCSEGSVVPCARF